MWNYICGLWRKGARQRDRQTDKHSMCSEHSVCQVGGVDKVRVHGFEEEHNTVFLDETLIYSYWLFWCKIVSCMSTAQNFGNRFG